MDRKTGLFIVGDKPQGRPSKSAALLCLLALLALCVVPSCGPESGAPRHRPVAWPTTHPDVKEWSSHNTYHHKDGRTICIIDSDCDSQLDADEILQYGTLRYDPNSRANAPSVRWRFLTPTPDRPYGLPSPSRTTTTPPPGSGPTPRDFAAMARRPLTPREDTAHDGIPDAWKLKYFGTVKPCRNDDDSGDGFPNIVKFYLGLDPTKVNLLDPAMKPKDLEDLPSPRTPWDIYWDIHDREFWGIQDYWRAKRMPAAAKR